MARPKKNTNKQLLADKMRKAVLQAAIEGKLTEQHPTTDGYARDLLADIESEKLRLIKAGEIKRQKSLPDITEEDKPFDIPDSWEWVRLGELISVSSGQGLTKAQMIDRAEYPVYGGNGINGYFNDFLVEEGTLTIGRVGFYCGATHKTISKSWVTDNALIVSKFSDNIDTDFLHYFLNHLDLKKSSVATAQPVISGQRISQLLLPLPPTLEQERIVTKLKEVLAQIDSLHADENALYVLQTAFPRQMQASLLQAAIEGKLTQQDATKDGCASDLLAEIESEKQRLIQAGEIKRQKTLPPIIEEEKPFDIPDNWEWVRLGDIFLNNVGGGTPSKSKPTYWNGDIPWASVKDLNSNILTQTQDSITQEGLDNSSSNLITKGTYIICTRMGLGKISLSQIDVAINQDLRAIFLPEKFIKRFFYYFYLTLKFVGKGATVKGITVNELNMTLMPLPPLAEQQRIVDLLEQALPEIQTLKQIQQ